MTTGERVRQWVQEYLRRILGVAGASVSVDQDLSTYGLDSVDAVLMAGEMENAFGIEIEPALFIACNSLHEIIQRTASEIDKAHEPQANR